MEYPAVLRAVSFETPESGLLRNTALNRRPEAADVNLWRLEGHSDHTAKVAYAGPREFFGVFVNLFVMLFQVVDELMEHIGEHRRVLHDELQEALHCVVAGSGPLSSERIQSAKLPELPVATQLAQQCRAVRDASK